MYLSQTLYLFFSISFGLCQEFIHQVSPCMKAREDEEEEEEEFCFTNNHLLSVLHLEAPSAATL